MNPGNASIPRRPPGAGPKHALTFGRRRYYGFDAIRSCLLILGVVLHVAIPYTGVPAAGFYRDAEKSWILAIAVPLIHYFRMPAFFLLSGFFSAMIWERGDPRAFLRARFKRVGAVWLIALGLSLPLVWWISIYNHFVLTRDHAPFERTVQAIRSATVDPTWLHAAPLHLWFLEYLLLFFLLAYAVAPLINGNNRMDHWTTYTLRSRFRTLLLAIPSALPLWFMPYGFVPYATTFIPWLGLSCYYGSFFAGGWLFFRQRDELSSLTTGRAVQAAFAGTLVPLTMLLLRMRATSVEPHSSSALVDLGIAFCTASFVWSVLLLLIAAFQNTKPRRWLPYAADASYWIYLAHYPLALLLPSLLRDWHVPAVWKVFLSTTLILTVLTVAYHLTVRFTFIGRVLHGTRLRVDCGSADTCNR